MWNGARECGWSHPPAARWGWEKTVGFRFRRRGFRKRQLVEFCLREKTVSFRLLAEATLCHILPVTLWREPHVLGGRWKTHHRKIVHLSSLCRRTFKLKGNKKFRTWTRKSCFSCFEIPMFNVYMLWTFYVRFTHSRIWLWYNNSFVWMITTGTLISKSSCSFFYCFGDCSKCTNYNWYHCHLHVVYLSSKV